MSSRDRMVRALLIPLALAATVLATAPSADAFTIPGKVKTCAPYAQLNEAWAGYTLHSCSPILTQVTAHFTVPEVKCQNKKLRLMAIWAGLGGHSPRIPLYQTGITLYCQNGKLNSYAWWEVYPDLKAQRFEDQPTIKPGDVFDATVYYENLSMDDDMTTRARRPVDMLLHKVDSNGNWTWGTGHSVTSDTDFFSPSAECIVEAPLLTKKLGGGHAVLPKFQPVKFSECWAITNAAMRNAPNSQIAFAKKPQPGDYRAPDMEAVADLLVSNLKHPELLAKPTPRTGTGFHGFFSVKWLKPGNQG